MCMFFSHKCYSAPLCSGGGNRKQYSKNPAQAYSSTTQSYQRSDTASRENTKNHSNLQYKFCIVEFKQDYQRVLMENTTLTINNA